MEKLLAHQLTTSQKHFIVAIQLKWLSRTPLGTPVEPDVYIMTAVSSFEGETSPGMGENLISKEDTMEEVKHHLDVNHQS